MVKEDFHQTHSSPSTSNTNQHNQQLGQTATTHLPPRLRTRPSSLTAFGACVRSAPRVDTLSNYFHANLPDQFVYLPHFLTRCPINVRPNLHLLNHHYFSPTLMEALAAIMIPQTHSCTLGATLKANMIFSRAPQKTAGDVTDTLASQRNDYRYMWI